MFESTLHAYLAREEAKGQGCYNNVFPLMGRGTRDGVMQDVSARLRCIMENSAGLHGERGREEIHVYVLALGVKFSTNNGQRFINLIGRSPLDPALSPGGHRLEGEEAVPWNAVFAVGGDSKAKRQ